MAVTAVGDCDPAVAAVNAATSGNAQMRLLVALSRRVSSLWLGVSVPREDNVDADRLSHPSQLEGVLADARAAGFKPVVVSAPQECWAALEGWLALDDA